MWWIPETDPNSKKMYLWTKENEEHFQLSKREEVQNRQLLFDWFVKSIRKKASAFSVYTKNRLAVPDDISKSNVHEIQELSEYYFKVLTQFEGNTNILGFGSHDGKYYSNTEEYIFFETGSEVLVRWTKEEIGDSCWWPGWFMAEVQDFSLVNNLIKPK